MSDVLQDLIVRFVDAKATLQRLSREPDLVSDDVVRLNQKIETVQEAIDALKGKVVNTPLTEDGVERIHSLMEVRETLTHNSYNSVDGALEGYNLGRELIRQTLHSIVD